MSWVQLPLSAPHNQGIMSIDCKDKEHTLVHKTLLSPPDGRIMWTEEHRDWTKVDYKPLAQGRAFPSDFMWGVATASHQIEGGNTNNWSAFEPGSKSQQLSGEACDHWHRRTDDVGLIKDLSLIHI